MNRLWLRGLATANVDRTGVRIYALRIGVAVNG